MQQPGPPAWPLPALIALTEIALTEIALTEIALTEIALTELPKMTCSSFK